METSILFFKRNYAKYKSVVFGLITFLLLINIMFGFISSVVGSFQSNVVGNSSLYFMQVSTLNNGAVLTKALSEKIQRIPGVAAVIPEYPNVYTLYGKSKALGTFTTFLGVPYKTLMYFGVKNQPSTSKEFLYLNQSVPNSINFKRLNMVHIDAIRYITKGGVINTEPYTVNMRVTDLSNISSIQILPPNISLIDQRTANQLALSSTPPGKEPSVMDFVVIVPNVSKMNFVSGKIQLLNSYLETRYDLKSTHQLPQFAVLVVTVSVTLFAILFAISLFNIRSSIKQLLTMRLRDIALFDILGVEIRSITSVFLTEFVFSAVISLLSALFVTFVVLELIRVSFAIDLISPYVVQYITIDILLAIVMIVITAYIEIKRIERKLINTQFYKEIIR